jgi:hypothetical protein
MATTVAERLAGVHPQMLRVEHEGDRKKLADLRPVIGQLVERAFALMGISKQDAAFRMGYRDPGTVSRWCTAVERPLFDKLFGLDGFDVAYVLAIAERNARIEVTTAITIRRIA